MRHTLYRKLLLGSVVLLAPASRIDAQQIAGESAAWASVERALGRPGAMQPAGIIKFSFPRSDLAVVASGVALKPAFALGSWVAFMREERGRSMLMGDLVLTEDEVAPVMRALQLGGVQQTALHNHLMHETPRVMYMHISAAGDATKLAQTIRSALAESHTPLVTPPAPALTQSPPIDLDTAAIARTLRVAGKVNGGVYQVSVPRRAAVHEGGHEIPPAMGVATAINFQPTDGGKAAVTGDFVMVASEVNEVIRALQQGGIQPTALHGHMLNEDPRLFFMHFWGNDDATALARTLRSALDRMAVK